MGKNLRDQEKGNQNGDESFVNKSKPARRSMSKGIEAEIQSMKKHIQRYFSQELKDDQSLRGAMERKQIEKWLLNWSESQ